MIIDRSFYREVIQTCLVVATVFISLYVVVSWVNLLARAAAGNLPVQLIFTLLGLQTVKNLGVILPLALFVGVLLTLSRWYRDSEMAVLAACGIGLLHFLRPVWLLAGVVAVIVGLVSFYFAPLASGVMNKIKHENREAYQAGILAGEFQRSRGDGSILYVEQVESDGKLENVFVSNPQFDRRGVVVAKSGYSYVDANTGNQYLVLDNGRRYEGTPGRADYKILEYERYSMRFEPQTPRERGTTIDETPTSRLWRSSDRSLAAEWDWRLAKPVALFILAPLALVFAYTDARRGRFANLFTAMLVYFFYANVLAFGHALLKQGRVPSWLGVWWVHALFALAAVYLLWRRARNKELLPSWRRA